MTFATGGGPHAGSRQSMRSAETFLQNITPLIAQTPHLASLVAQTVENPPAMKETRVQSLGREDSPGGGHGNPLQSSCLENPMDRGAWWAAVQGVAKSQI